MHGVFVTLAALHGFLVPVFAQSSLQQFYSVQHLALLSPSFFYCDTRTISNQPRSSLNGRLYPLDEHH